LGKSGDLNKQLTPINAVILDEYGVLVIPKKTTALLDSITHHCAILETGNDAYRFKQRKKTTGKFSKPLNRARMAN